MSRKTAALGRVPRWLARESELYRTERYPSLPAGFSADPADWVDNDHDLVRVSDTVVKRVRRSS